MWKPGNAIPNTGNFRRLLRNLRRMSEGELIMGTAELDTLQQAKANLELLLDDIENVEPETLLELKITARVIRRKMEAEQVQS
jgi:hypothetical protein